MAADPAAGESRGSGGQQLAWVERLRKVVVRSHLQTRDAIHIFAARGEHQHGDTALRAQAPEDLETVQARQHDIQNHQIEAAVEGAVQAASAFVLALDSESFARQELDQQGAQLGVIVDQQDLHG